MRSAAAVRVLVVSACAAVVASLISIAVAQTLLGLSLALALIQRFGDRSRLSWRFLPIAAPLAVFVALTLLSLLASGDPAAGLPQVRKFFVYLILFSVAAAVHRWRQVEWILIGTLAAGSGSALLGIVQYVQKWLAARDAGEDFTQAYVGDRITGFMSHWMTFGGHMTIVLMLAAAWVFFASKWRRPAAAAALLTIAALLLGWTRGMWIGSAAGIVYLVWVWRRKLVLLMPVAAIGGFFIAPATIQDRVVSIAKPRSQIDSNDHRHAMLLTGVAIIRAHPLLGVGPEMVQRRFAEYAPAEIDRPFPSHWWYGHLHNIYLHFAAERGVPALIALLFAIGKALKDFVQAASRTKTPARRAFLHGVSAAIVAVLVTGLFEYNLGDSEVLQLFLGLVAAAYFAVEQPAEAQ